MAWDAEQESDATFQFVGLEFQSPTSRSNSSLLSAPRFGPVLPFVTRIEFYPQWPCWPVFGTGFALWNVYMQSSKTYFKAVSVISVMIYCQLTLAKEFLF